MEGGAVARTDGNCTDAGEDVWPSDELLSARDIRERNDGSDPEECLCVGVCERLESVDVVSRLYCLKSSSTIDDRRAALERAV